MRRRRGAFLCFDVNCEAGLEFRGEVVVVNGDLLDQLSDEAFVEFGDFGLLTSDKILQLGDDIVVLLAVSLSDELLLQLIEPGLNTVRAHRVGGYDSFCNVLLHLPDMETIRHNGIKYPLLRLWLDV